MSQSLLYHAFGIPKTYRYVRTEYQKGAVWYTVRPEGEPECCPHCQSKEFVGQSRSRRRVGGGGDGVDSRRKVGLVPPKTVSPKTSVSVGALLRA